MDNNIRQYALKWNDFHVKLTSSFQYLRNEFDFIDVTLAGDGYSFSAHKVILSACSPYFRQLLKANPCQHPIIILRDVNKQNMENLLMFMYNGEVNLEHEQLADFIKAAQLLKIRGLADIKDTFAQLESESFGNEDSTATVTRSQEKFTANTHKYEQPMATPVPASELILPNLIPEPDPHSMEVPSSSHEPEQIDNKIAIVNLIEPKQELIDEDLSLEDVCSAEDISNMSSMSNQSYNDHDQGNNGNDTATTSNQSPPGSSDLKRPRVSIDSNRHLVRSELETTSSKVSNFQCTECTRIYSTASNLRGHMDRKHNPNFTGYLCQHCNKNYSALSNLNSHIEHMHNPNRERIPCKYCTNMYSTTSNLRRHVIDMHSKTPRVWFSCDKCEQKFRSKLKLDNHDRRSHSIIAFNEEFGVFKRNLFPNK